MVNESRDLSVLLVVVLLVSCQDQLAAAEQTRHQAGEPGQQLEDRSALWHERVAENARIMSQVKWTPVAEGMPMQWRGHFKKGNQYTGVPYSNQSHDGQAFGRTIGFEISLKTFLAAVENPASVLYTERIPESRHDGAFKSYYGMVCSSFTSYVLQCGFQFLARQHDPHDGGGGRRAREGIVRVDPQSAHAAKVGDIIQSPSHVEVVTGITRDDQGVVTHVRVEDSRPPTVRTRSRSVSDFDSHISSGGRGLYRITDLDAWRENNRAEWFLFPNYAHDSTEPTINRVLLLDRGDWVPYFAGQDVRINVMDTDSRGVEALVVKRGDAVVEEIALDGTGIIERAFDVCGDYTAHCVMSDGSLSQACEFSVCELDFRTSATEVTRDQSWEIEFTSCNMKIAYVYLRSAANQHGLYHVVVSERDREKGSVTIPAGLLQAKDTGLLWVRLFAENRYGRLHRQKTITVVE